MSKHAAALLLFVLGVLAACSPATSHDHEARIALPIDPTSLSPIIAFNQDQIALDLLWCQTLVGLDDHNHFIPILLTRIPSHANGDVSADGLRITYHLRRGLRFADGVALTSADVAFTFAAILDPANAAGGSDDYTRIVALRTPDANTVTIRLRKPWSAAVHVLFAQADYAYGILPKHAFVGTKTVGSAWDQKPFGSGPFRVTAWHRGEDIELEPNPYFSPLPKLKRIILRIIPNQTAAVHALQTHEVDIAELNPDNVDQAAKIAELRVVRIAENGLRALYLQTTAEPTSELHVRRAVAYALDRSALSKAWRGAYPAARSLYPAPLVAWPAALPPAYPHDLAAAGREFDAAGWRLHDGVRAKNGQPLVMSIAIDATLDVVARIALLVQEQLAPLGVEVSIKPYATNLLSAPDGPLRGGRFALSPAALIGGSDPEQSINLQCAQSHGGGGNYSRYCSPRVEALLAAQMRAATEAQRDHDFDLIAGVVHDDVPLIPLYDLMYLQGVNKRITGYARNMLRFPVRPEEWDAR